MRVRLGGCCGGGGRAEGPENPSERPGAAGFVVLSWDNGTRRRDMLLAAGR